MWARLPKAARLAARNVPGQWAVIELSCLLVLQWQTGRSCVMCGRESERLYATDRSLQRHMELAHGRTMCSVCLKVGLRVWAISGCWRFLGMLDTGR